MCAVKRDETGHRVLTPAAAAKRTEKFYKDGEPIWVRCYDNEGTSADQFVACFTGRYREKFTGEMRRQYGAYSWFQYVAMSAHPFHPQGVGMHGEHSQQIDVNKWGFAPTYGRKGNCGRRIHFNEMPIDCQLLVATDYRDIWDAPWPAQLKERLEKK